MTLIIKDDIQLDKIIFTKMYLKNKHYDLLMQYRYYYAKKYDCQI